MDSQIEIKTSTALWVYNHAAGSHRISPGRDHTEIEDEGVRIGNGYSHESTCSSKSNIENSTRGLLAPTSNDYLDHNLRLTRSLDLRKVDGNAFDLKTSIDDLSSIASTQPSLRLQLKRVKLFNLRKFGSKSSMNSSKESLNSNGSDSLSRQSSFVSHQRPPFPSNITPNSSFNSQKSVKSSLQPYIPHPEFNKLAGKLLQSYDSKLHDNSSSKLLGALNSASDSTLLDDSDEADKSSDDEDEGTDMRSPIKENCLLPLPSKIADVHDSFSKIDNEEGSLSSSSTNQKRKSREKRLRTGAHALTHPPIVVKPEIEVDHIAKDSNNFQSFQLTDKTLDRREEIVSEESLYGSQDGLEGGSSLLNEVLGEINSKSESQFGLKRVNRHHKSEPFGKEKPFVIETQSSVSSSKSSPAISTRPASLQSVDEDIPGFSQPSTLWDKENLQQSEDKRKAIVEEIIASEEKYVKNLEQITQAVTKIREDGVLDEESMNVIFHNIRLTATAVHHSILLDSLKRVVSNGVWDPKKAAIGHIMCNTFQKETLHDNYLSYVKNVEESKELIKLQLSKNTSFHKFNEKFRSHNKSGFDLKDAVSLPANRLSSYKMLLERYLKNTPLDHEDYHQVPKAIRIVKEFLDLVGKVDSRSRQTTLKDLERILDVSELISPDREFIRVDFIKLQGQHEEFGLWMFSDLILITVSKHLGRNSQTRKSSIVVHGHHGQEIVVGSKRFYKLYMRVGLDDTEVVYSPETELKKIDLDMENISSDLETFREVNSKLNSLNTPQEHLHMEVSNLISSLEKRLITIGNKREGINLASLTVNLHMTEGGRECTFLFKDPKTRSAWENDLLSARLNLEAAMWNKLPPQFIDRLPVDKTRAGMQFTCAATSLVTCKDKEVWFCNSDSTAGHLCRISATAKPAIIDYVELPKCSSKINCICITPELSNSLTPNGNADTKDSLIWLGCDDGMLHIIDATPGVPLSESNHTVHNCTYSITSMCYMEGKVFISQNNKWLLVYQRSADGTWNMNSPHSLQLNTQSYVSQLLPVSAKLWCASHNEITIVDPVLRLPERTFKVGTDKKQSIQSMAYSRQGIVAVAMKSSCEIKLFHYNTLRHLLDVNVFSPVAQKLSKCDEIIKQHKTACLKVTSLACCKHMLWIGTTAGVICTLRLPKVLSVNLSPKELEMPPLEINALDIGHTGNVRVLAVVELYTADTSKDERRQSVARKSLVTKQLVISGGDGYEIVDPSFQSKDSVGFNDSINHLLAWSM